MKEIFTKEEIDIIVDALLHEMERYNDAMTLVSDITARKAVEKAKNKVSVVFTKANSFTEE